MTRPAKSKPVTTKRERVAAQEDNILAAAKTAFLEHRYDGAKMSIIAKAAGVGDGTLYLYYKNKNDIVAAVLDRHWQALQLEAETMLAGIEGSADKLEAFAEFHLTRLARDWHIVELGYVQSIAGDAALSRTIEHLTAYSSLFTAIVEQGIDRDEFFVGHEQGFYRDLFFGTCEYAVRGPLAVGRAPDIDAIKISVLQTLTRVLSPNNDSPKSNDNAHLQTLTRKLEALTNKLEGIA